MSRVPAIFALERARRAIGGVPATFALEHARRAIGRGRAAALLAAGAIVATALLGCGGGGDAPDRPAVAAPGDTLQLPAPDSRVELPDYTQLLVDSIRSAEARRLEQAAARARRVSIDRLWLLPGDAEPVAFDDRLDGELMLLHVYRGRLPQGYALLEVIRMEGGAFLLVDERTGARFEIDAVPAVSPDGARFATASFDVVAGHVPNRLIVYRFDGNGIATEWTLEPREWGPSDVEWLDGATLRFQRNDIDTSVQPFRVTQTPATARRAAGGWQTGPGTRIP